MKLIKWLFLFAFIPVLTNAQNVTQYKTVYDLFKKGQDRTTQTTMNDTIFTQYDAYDAWGGRLVFYTIASDTTVDSLISNKMRNRITEMGSNWNTCIFFGIMQDTAHAQDAEKDTMDVDLNMGVFRGYGYGSGGDQTIDLNVIDSTGWVEYNLFSMDVATATTPDTIYAVQLSDSTWWTDYPTTMWYLEIVEGDTTKNRYFINVFQFGVE